MRKMLFSILLLSFNVVAMEQIQKVNNISTRFKFTEDPLTISLLDSEGTWHFYNAIPENLQESFTHHGNGNRYVFVSKLDAGDREIGGSESVYKHEVYISPPPYRAVSEDGKLFASITEDGSAITIFDLATMREFPAIKCASKLTGLRFHPENDKIAVADSKGTISLFELADGKLIRSVQGNLFSKPNYGDKIVSLQFGKSGDKLAVTSIDVAIIVDIEHDFCLRSFVRLKSGNESELSGSGLSADGKFLAVSYFTRVNQDPHEFKSIFRIFDVEEHREISSFLIDTELHSGVKTVEFTNDNQAIFFDLYNDTKVQLRALDGKLLFITDRASLQERLDEKGREIQ